jgi:molybdopterin-containing oxidoreductase family iron-sulfur binding subunit
VTERLWRTLHPTITRTGECEDARPDVSVDAIHRRSFLKRMAAAIALAGGGLGCERAPSGTIHPYVAQPPEVTPGNPRYYATALSLDGYAQGLLVASREGRPVKVEGNPEHPASLGAAGPFEQGAVLGVYDPDRARVVVDRHGGITTFEAATQAIARRPWSARRGQGLTIVMEPTSSKSIGDLLARLRQAFPEIDLRWFTPASRSPTWDGARSAFGRVLEPRYDLRQADVLLVLDADPVARGPAWMRWARHFADRRRSPKEGMSRVYVVEPRITPTGASGDHRLPVRRSEVGAVAAAILAALAPDRVGPRQAEALRARTAKHARWIAAVAKDLASVRGRGLVIAGDTQPPEVHVLAHAIDATLGNLGHAKTFGESPILEAGARSHDVRPLAAALDSGGVDSLVVIGTNLAYASPVDLRFRELIGRATESLYVGEYRDETATRCTWSAPLAHVLETWGDARAFDGTRSVVQPLIAPLLGGRTSAQILASLLGEPNTDPYQLTRRSLRGVLGASFERPWQDALVHGVVPGTSLPEIDVTFRWTEVAATIARLPAPVPEGAVEIAIDLDRRVYDGRFGNVAWLAEMPEPITTQSWGNALLVGHAMAARLGLADEDVVRVAAAGNELSVPVLVASGIAEGTVAINLGWGRDAKLTIARGHGVDAYPLLRGSAPWSQPVTIAKTGATRPLAVVQEQYGIWGRDKHILPHATTDALKREERVAPEPREYPPALYANRPTAPRQWGMMIDLNACTACSSCVVACQAENNVPTVGFSGVRKGREMLWLEINIYHEGDPENPSTFPQPMLCQHCEMAPCEYVCPVAATAHSDDGINEMTYNRCVGTRFCSNNCPYKIRRFNWFYYHQDEPDLRHLVHNPDVTVRARGVMEKCTYCVQRIRRGEIREDVERRPLRDGDIKTACEQACPTNAIIFGDINDRDSRVSRLRQDPRNYAVLDDLGTVPRTRYLARITNPNPELA